MSNPALVNSCRYCQFYVPEGRRGGSCQQLNVSVQSTWKACPLAVPPFQEAHPWARNAVVESHVHTNILA